MLLALVNLVLTYHQKRVRGSYREDLRQCKRPSPPADSPASLPGIFLQSQVSITTAGQHINNTLIQVLHHIVSMLLINMSSTYT